MAFKVEGVDTQEGIRRSMSVAEIRLPGWKRHDAKITKWKVIMLGWAVAFSGTGEMRRPQACYAQHSDGNTSHKI